jgi:hypothetical protein
MYYYIRNIQQIKFKSCNNYHNLKSVNASTMYHRLDCWCVQIERGTLEGNRDSCVSIFSTIETFFHHGTVYKEQFCGTLMLIPDPDPDFFHP